MKTRLSLAVTAIAALGTFGCQRNAIDVPSVDAARAFLTEANNTMLRLGNEASQAGWVQNTYITPDTEAMAARAKRGVHDRGDALRQAGGRYDEVELPASRAAAADRAQERARRWPRRPIRRRPPELAQLVTAMEGCTDAASSAGRRIGRRLPRHRRDHRDSREGAEPGATSRGVGRMAFDRRRR